MRQTMKTIERELANTYDTPAWVSTIVRFTALAIAFSATSIGILTLAYAIAQGPTTFRYFAVIESVITLYGILYVGGVVMYLSDRAFHALLKWIETKLGVKHLFHG